MGRIFSYWRWSLLCLVQKQFKEDSTSWLETLLLSSKFIKICVTWSVPTLSFRSIPAKVGLQYEKIPPIKFWVISNRVWEWKIFNNIQGNWGFRKDVDAVIDSSWSRLIFSYNYNILEFIPLSVKVIWRFVNIILCFGKPKKIMFKYEPVCSTKLP